MSDDLLARAGFALHERRAAAMAAARGAGLPGEFSTFEDDGLLASVATDPALSFLTSVHGVTPATVSGLPDVLERLGPAAGSVTVVVAEEHRSALAPALRSCGLEHVAASPVAVASLPLPEQVTAPPGPIEVVDGSDDRRRFLDVLAAGYEVAGPIEAFLRCEHEGLGLARSLAVRGGRDVGAAAWSRHGPVAVLGGASTIGSARGTGVQATLLAERLTRATEAGCEVATATAVEGSASLRNLARAGLTIVRRHGWRRGDRN